MKGVYWKPPGRALRGQALIAAVALVGIVAVESFPIDGSESRMAERQRASRLALEAMREIRAERLRRGIPIDRETDPADSGLIGLAMSPVTSDPGSLPAKQTTINPNFAALLVQWLAEADVREGDAVAIGFSGSFPALNVCVCAAVETLGLRPIIITSAAASQWGANHPDFLWLDMERHLRGRGILKSGSAAASIGGLEDRGVGMSKPGRDLLLAAIRRNAVPAIEPRDFADGVDCRMAIYQKRAGASPIAAYINVGGGTISVGSRIGKRLFRPGLNLRVPRGLAGVDSVTARFIRAGTPVIHLVRIEQLATSHKLPICPTAIPPVGHGIPSSTPTPNRWLIVTSLIAILLALQLTKPPVPTPLEA